MPLLIDYSFREAAAARNSGSNHLQTVQGDMVRETTKY